jgi:hypothetical protein
MSGTNQPAAGQLAFPIPNELIDRLADAIVSRLLAALAQQAHPVGPPARRLLTLDELVALLPTGKTPATWKRWLYQRTRHNQIPGCHKIGNRLFFDQQQTLPWLTGSPNTTGLDLPGEQSLHDPAMLNDFTPPGDS